ncbi:phage tail protein [Cytobacillus solani]|uniref:phage tail protein n=1 Tax=Cytobacillus solani TaxID=1637975 RepID=UPI0006AB93C4|nr:phage tail protein [Cytobacillus solani]KOP70975.1 hypothetical protein AMS60_23245 [Bacillus sp. FJAT-21945]USK55909.1 phage tail protein [Cytobacillus solani]
MATIKRQRADGSWEYIQITGEDVNTLKNDVVAHLAKKSTLLKEGHVQLSSATDSMDETKAATPKAVKAAMDKANQAFMSANNGKLLVRDAIIGKSSTVAGGDNPTFQQLADGVNGITGKLYIQSITLTEAELWTAIDKFENYYIFSGQILDKYGNLIRTVPYDTQWRYGLTQDGYIDGWTYDNMSNALYNLKDINGTFLRGIPLGGIDQYALYRKEGHVVCRNNNQRVTWIMDLNGTVLRRMDVSTIYFLNKNNNFVLSYDMDKHATVINTDLTERNFMYVQGLTRMLFDFTSA